MADTETKQSAGLESAESSYSIHPDLMNFIIQALNEKDTARVRELTSDMHAADIAELINIVSSEQREELTKAIRRDFDPEVLVELENEVKEEVITQLGAEKTAEVISRLESDDAVQVMEDLGEGERQKILEAIPEGEKKEDLEEGLAYPENSVGRMMDKKFVAVPLSWNVGQTIDFLREEENLPHDFYTVFVHDDDGKPLGFVLTSRIIRNKRDIAIKDIMDTELKTVTAEMDQEEVAHIFQKYWLSSTPVLDNNGKIIGIVSLDDIVHVVTEEAEEDIMRLGGVTETDINSPYLKTAFRRFPWLFINLLTAIAASFVVAMFDGAIEKIVALAVLMPIVASMANNAGTQTVTVAVRAIATKELTTTNAMRVVLKEIGASCVNGALVAVSVAGVVFFIYNDLHLSMVLASAIMLSIMLTCFAGTMIPLALVKMGADPAIASSVFLTTVSDISAFFFFLGLASLFLV